MVPMDPRRTPFHFEIHPPFLGRTMPSVLTRSGSATTLRNNSLAEFDEGGEERIGRAKPGEEGIDQRMESQILRAPQHLFNFQSRKFVNSSSEFAGCRHRSRNDKF
ncbi:unnamed protein product [Linum trigynum]|uniref:Uncharacterized protein n=1 Tax=Linum trigynum TaxID=586398 RepID=A0AAV2GA33_9ROSI